MGHQVKDQELAAGRRKFAAWYLAEIALLFLILVGSLTWLEFALSDFMIWVAVGMVPVYLLWLVAGALWRPIPGSPRRLRIAVFLVVQIFCGVVLVAGLVQLAGLVWFEAVFGVEDYGFGHFGFLQTPTLAAGMVLASIVLIVLFLPLLRDDEEGYASFYGRVRRQGVGSLGPVAATSILLGIGLHALLGLGLEIYIVSILQENLYPHLDVGFWTVLARMPTLLLLLIVGAVLMPTCRRMLPASLASFRRPRPAGGLRLPARLALAGISVAWLVPNLHFLHILGLIINVPAGMAGADASIGEGVGNWVEARMAEGRPAAEIVADLRKTGNWSNEEPEDVSARQIPDLAEAMQKAEWNDECSVSFGVDVVDGSELEAREWVKEFGEPGRIKYCVKLACPSSVAWQSNPVVWFISSHPTKKPTWTESFNFIDLQANGRAFEPGGYCTVDGELADDYQG